MKQPIILITGAGVGGAERVTVLFAKILKRAGYNTYLILYQNGETNDLKTFIPEDIPYDIVVCRIRYLPFKLIKKIKTLKPQIVFVSLFHVALAASVATYLLRKPYKYIVRDCNTPSYHPKVQIQLARKLFKICDVLIAQTEEMRQQMIETYSLAADRIVTIYNPIDKKLIDERIRDAVIMDPGYCNYIAVGRISQQKDYVTLLNSFVLVRKRQPNARLYFIGKIDNTYKKVLDEIIDQYRIRDYIFFENYQANPYKYIKSADVFVLSSKYEGLPNVLIEAMYLEKPVVATRCIPYIQQVIKEGVNGYTTEVGDYELFAQKMLLASKLKNIRCSIDVNNSEKEILQLFSSFEVSGKRRS